MFGTRSKSATAVAAPAAPAGQIIDLFSEQKAVEATAKPKKAKGTVLRLDGDESLDAFIAAKDAMERAVLTLESARGHLLGNIRDKWCEATDTIGDLPSTPVTVTGSKNQSITFTVSDGSNTASVTPELLTALSTGLPEIGEELAREVTETTTWSFNPEIMQQASLLSEGNKVVPVEEVVKRVVNVAISSAAGLTDEQKRGLIALHRKRHFVNGTVKKLFGKMVTKCGGKRVLDTLVSCKLFTLGVR